MIHFTDSDISDLKAIDIQEVLDYYNVEKQRNNKFLCPFHDDSDPSLILNRRKNVCDCYVCNKRWDTIEFVRDMEYKSFTDALITLVKISGGNIHKYMQCKEIKLPNLRRLNKEEKILLEFEIGAENITTPMKPIKNWSLKRDGDSLPNYNHNKDSNFYDGYVVMQKPKLTENYIYTNYPDVYRSLVIAKLTVAISKIRNLYENGEDVSREIAMLNKLKTDFGYSNQKTQS